MKLESARAALAAAHAKAAELGLPGVAVAVVDAGGSLVVFERAPGPFMLSGLVAEAKAATSAVSGMATAMLNGAETRFPKLTDPLAARLGARFSLYGGGHPVRVGDQLIGAVGVSGGSPEQDAVIAEAAAAVAAST